ncbi:hypothetical protein [Pseudoteredinibacter isoporae]|uniref:Uncharacterized protein n=1 Tax=Pseudoteredinibacter isoporae TaxID=570281 RepID=A0A7X0JQY7_9GAMM|nr:hypothetical protein [Pseudoteredinibacter isoporae]MBB6520625.1 hypothetical protein [Pseudoteredinibacter isoporae]NHO86192.1 hypothetical protein [Pseudoteredinibacter isoporae]NIB25357.1 hypothetical protein [Pseudoteredinibacter isoporae]
MKKGNIFIGLYFLIFTIGLSLSVLSALNPLHTEGEYTNCNRDGGYAEYVNCRKIVADRYIKIEYPQVKDLSKMFFTLVTAIFVASITFSEKILMTPKPGSFAKFSMVAAWISMLCSIIACGSALALVSLAYDQAAWSELRAFPSKASSGIALYIISGALFVWGLILFVVTSAWSLYHSPTESVATA